MVREMFPPAKQKTPDRYRSADRSLLGGESRRAHPGFSLSRRSCSEVTLGSMDLHREQIALREAPLGHTPSDSTTPLWLGGSIIIYGALVMWVGILVSWPA